jgi:Flp pilus assembly secretin CpaC
MRALRPFVAAIVTACVFATSGAASARDIRVALDQAFPLRLADAAEGVAVGNPSIAGVSIQNDHFLFVTGRSYGTTSLTVLGADNRILYSGRIVVTPDETGAVIVTRGGETARLECSPICRPRPDIGDGQASQQVNEQITSHATTATGGSH